MNTDSPIKSLDEVVATWAWDRFSGHFHCPKVFLKSFYKLQISWTNVISTQSDATFIPHQKDNKNKTLSSQSETANDDEAMTSPGSDTVNDDEATTSPRSETANDHEATTSPGSETANDLLTDTQRFATHETLVTEFNNRSNEQQQHTLQVQQTVRSTCNVVMTKGVTHGGTCSFNLKVPQDIVGAGATYQFERVVTDSKEQKFEHEVTWSGTCQVTVSPYTRSEARAVSTTCWVVRQFRLDKFFSGIVSVSLKPRLGKQLQRIMHESILEIVSNDRKKRIDGSIDGNRYKTTIDGECTFQYFVKHKIEVSHEALPKPKDTPLE